MAMLFIIMKKMTLLVIYSFLLWTYLFGSFVPHQWLVWKDIRFGSFQSAFIVVAFGGKFVLDPLQSFFFCRIWREVVLDPFQSASIVAASGGKLVFWFVAASGGKFVFCSF